MAADGRPYLVMEYCSSTLGQRYRAVRLPRSPRSSPSACGSRSAVETAHRQGVLHRDIKPSNILTTAYGHPVLSDFGIAATLGEAETNEAVGLSIPWSAPEVLHDEISGTVASEVWSLGATVYSLLAGRSPFEVPGGDNATIALMSRIEKAKPAPDRAGRRAAQPRADPRPLHVASVRRTARPARSSSSATCSRSRRSSGCRRPPSRSRWTTGRSRPRSISTSAPASAASAPSPTARADAGARADRARARRAPCSAQTPVPTTAPSARRRTAPPTTRRLVWGISVAAALIVALVGAGVIAVVQGTRGIPVVTDVEGAVAGTSVTFTWSDPGIESGDAYIVTVDGQASPMTRDAHYDVPAQEGDRVCATVTVTRDGKSGTPSAERCVDVQAGGG